MKNTKVITFTNIKGGVGKTTSVVNVAYSIPLVEEGAKVLVIDSDPQGNASQSVLLDEDAYVDCCLSDLYKDMMYGYKPTIQDIAKRIYQAYKDVETFDENGNTIIETIPYNFHIMPTMIGMHILEKSKDLEDGIIPRRGLETECVLLDIINMIIQYLDYDYILIDCPPNIGTFVYNAVVACDYIVIPISIGAYSLRGVEYTLSIIDVMRSKRKHGILNLGILSSIYKKGQAAAYTDEKIFADFPVTEKFLTNIPNTVKVDNSTIEGNLISDVSKEVGDAYRKVAIELIWKVHHQDELAEERKQRIALSDRLNDIYDAIADIEEQILSLEETESDSSLEKKELLANIKALNKEKKEIFASINATEDARRDVMFEEEYERNRLETIKNVVMMQHMIYDDFEKQWNLIIKDKKDMNAKQIKKKNATLVSINKQIIKLNEIINTLDSSSLAEIKQQIILTTHAANMEEILSIEDDIDYNLDILEKYNDIPEEQLRSPEKREKRAAKKELKQLQKRKQMILDVYKGDE